MRALVGSSCCSTSSCSECADNHCASGVVEGVAGVGIGEGVLSGLDALRDLIA